MGKTNLNAELAKDTEEGKQTERRVRREKAKDIHRSPDWKAPRTGRRKERREKIQYISNTNVKAQY
jgi:hypothetical protein